MDCIEFQARHDPDMFKDLGYKNLMPIHGSPSVVHILSVASFAFFLTMI